MEVSALSPSVLRCELPDIKNMKPSLLIGLFETAIEDECSARSAGVLFSRIQEIDLGVAEINQIIGLSSSVYSHSVNLLLKSQYIDFCNSHLNRHNVFVYLKNAKAAHADNDVKVCLDYISDKFGIEINREGDSLHVLVVDPKISWNKLSHHFSTLSKIWDGKFLLSITPTCARKIEDFLRFIETQGKFIIELDLIIYKGRITDNFINRAISSSPNVQTLLIDSYTLDQEGFEQIESLSQLKSLFMSGCRTTTIKKWPGNLTELTLTGHDYLSSIPEEWPKDLKKLTFGNCPELKHIPKWPEGLDEFILKTHY